MKKSTKRKKEYQKILKLRNKGLSYRKIANIVGVSKNSVFLVCKGKMPKFICIPWSPEEEQYLLKMTGEHSENLSRCFALVAKKLGRTVSAVTSRYYSHIRPKAMTLNNCSFMLVDNKKINPQTKRVFEVRSNPIPIKKGMFQKIKEYINSLIKRG